MSRFLPEIVKASIMRIDLFSIFSVDDQVAS